MSLTKRSFCAAEKENDNFACGQEFGNAPEEDQGSSMKRPRMTTTNISGKGESSSSGVQINRKELFDKNATPAVGSNVDNETKNQTKSFFRRSFSESPQRQGEKSIDLGSLIHKSSIAPIFRAGFRIRSASTSEMGNSGFGSEAPFSIIFASVQNQLPTSKKLKPLPYENGKAAWSSNQTNRAFAYCEKYADDLWDYLFLTEGRNNLPANFLLGSKFTPRMRMIALDWMTEFQSYLYFSVETQLTALHLFDRYLMARRHTADKNHVQVCALACIAIAAKQEEFYIPDFSTYVQLMDCSIQELISAEIKVLRVVHTDLNYPRVDQFIRRLSEHYDFEVHRLAKAIGDVAVHNYATCHYKPSEIAAAAVYMAAFLEGFEFPEKLYSMARASKDLFEKLVPHIAAALLWITNNKALYPSLYRKITLHRIPIFSDEHLVQLAVFAGDCKVWAIP